MSTRHVSPSTQLASFNCPYPECGANSHQYWYFVKAKQMRNGSFPFCEENVKGLASPHTDTILNLMNEAAVHQGRSVSYPRESASDLSTHLQKWGEQIMSRALFFYKNSYPHLFFEDTQNYYNVDILNLSQCYSCGGIAIWVYNQLIYPRSPDSDAPPANPDLPKDIKQDYDEAASILDLSHRGAAALLRVATEKLCNLLVATGKAKGETLNKKIEYMVKNGLPEQVENALHALRVTGNNAVHPLGEINVKDDRKIAENLFWCINEIVDYGITRPNRIDSAYNKIPKRLRLNIERGNEKDK